MPPSWVTLPGENILEYFLKMKSRDDDQCRVVEFLGAIFEQGANFMVERLDWALQRWDGGGAAVRTAPQTISFGKSAN